MLKQRIYQAAGMVKGIFMKTSFLIKCIKLFDYLKEKSYTFTEVF